MKVLFRAQVANIGSLAEKFIKKLIESDGRFYCIGFESLLNGEYIIIDEDGNCFECIYDTRAIHFENMIDLDKNKIFASLSEDGKGGDVVTHPDYEDNKYILIYDKDRFEVGIKLIEIDEKGCWEYSSLQEEELELFEVIGIQK